MNQTHFENMDQAFAAIDGLGELAAREVSVKALTDAGRPIKEDIERRLEPHRFSGALAADIAITESTEAAGQGEVAVLIGAKDEAYKLFWLEYGAPGNNQPATPIIRPAWDSGRNDYVRRVVASFSEAYRSVVAKYTRAA
jgi:hypothetical protein